MQPFADLVDGMRKGLRPEWTTPSLAESTSRLVVALRAAAPRVSLTLPGREPLEVRAADLDALVWQVADLHTSVEVAVVGRLDALDLVSGNIRVRDDVGNRIPLRRVEEPEEAAKHVGQRVRAVGTAVRDDDGRVKRLVDVSVEPADLPTSWTTSGLTDLTELLAATPGPDPDGGVELTDEEFESFLRAARG